MAGGYSLTMPGATITGASTLLWLNPIASPNIDFSFRRFWLGQSNNMASAQQRVQISTQVTAFPTLATATAPAKLVNVDSASVLTGNTTGAAGYTGVNASGEGGATRVVIWPDCFNVVNGWLLVLTPDELITMGAGSASGIGMWLPTAPGTLTLWTAGMTWTEE